MTASKTQDILAVLLLLTLLGCEKVVSPTGKQTDADSSALHRNPLKSIRIVVGEVDSTYPLDRHLQAIVDTAGYVEIALDWSFSDNTQSFSQTRSEPFAHRFAKPGSVRVHVAVIDRYLGKVIGGGDTTLVVPSITIDTAELHHFNHLAVWLSGPFLVWSGSGAWSANPTLSTDTTGFGFEDLAQPMGLKYDAVWWDGYVFYRRAVAAYHDNNDSVYPYSSLTNASSFYQRYRFDPLSGAILEGHCKSSVKYRWIGRGDESDVEGASLDHRQIPIVVRSPDTLVFFACGSELRQSIDSFADSVSHELNGMCNYISFSDWRWSAKPETRLRITLTTK